MSCLRASLGLGLILEYTFSLCVRLGLWSCFGLGLRLSAGWSSWLGRGMFRVEFHVQFKVMFEVWLEVWFKCRFKVMFGAGFMVWFKGLGLRSCLKFDLGLGRVSFSVWSKDLFKAWLRLCVRLGVWGLVYGQVRVGFRFRCWVKFPVWFRVSFVVGLKVMFKARFS
jgi:hypothetical protein